jgi:hypothetical protein
MNAKNRAAYAALILAVGAYVVYFAVRIVAMALLKAGGTPKVLPLMIIPPVLAVCAVAIGHLARRGPNGGPSSLNPSISMSALILGYIFLACSLFATGVIVWFSHAMKDFD